MANRFVRDSTDAKLRALAAGEQRSVSAVMDSAVEQYKSPSAKTEVEVLRDIDWTRLPPTLREAMLDVVAKHYGVQKTTPGGDSH